MRLSHAKTFDIRFEHLRTFLALSDFGSFSVTGNQIGLSQSAVSRHIRALESVLGLRLFDRIGRRTVLTSSGKVLRTRLVALNREAEALPRLVKDLAEGVRGELRVGACVTAATSFLPMLLGRYRQKHPEVRLAMHLGSSAKAIEGLRRGDFDLAFIASTVVPPDVTVAATVRDEIVLVAAANHHLPKRQARAQELADCDFIQREPTSDTRALTTAWFESRV